MSRKLDIASGIAVALTVAFTLASADGSGAAAQSRTVPSGVETPVPAQAGNPLVAGAPDNLLPAAYPAPALPVRAEPREVLPPPVRDKSRQAQDDYQEGLSLAALVAQQDVVSEVSRELSCLAGAIYFEAKSETLEGQLAVGRVVVNRARSGRFPSSYCGVVFQRSQFSFVRGNAMPAINRASRDWKEALAIARLADEGRTGPAEGALFFHATHVSPGWRLTRIARVDNHVFYR